VNAPPPTRDSNRQLTFSTVLFLNTALLLGALGVLIPIAIHLLNRRSSRVVDWGAMNFLLESLAIRNRRIQLEEALLMAARCLLVGLLALAVARPFVPPGSSVPWLVVLPLLLVAIVGLGVSVVLHNEPRWRWLIGGISLLLLLACAALVIFEKHLNLSRFSPGARQDIAIIIDASTSMTAQAGGTETNFDRAVEEVRILVKRAPRGHAFSLILGGPSPSAKVLDPTTDRADLEDALDDLVPLDGPMAAYDALTLASLSLARGDHPAKQIVVFTDEQNVGWETGKSGRWNFLREAFRNLPTEPQIILRKLPLPPSIRNLAVTDLRLSRDIVGVDRPVEISVTVENTGDEAVTPGGLMLSAGGGADYRDQSLGQIQPGETRTVTFLHLFTTPGAHSLTATLQVEDEIEVDNRGHYALNVARGLRVLLVDGRPSGPFFQRATSFAALALAPSSLTLDPTLEPNRPTVSDSAAEDYDMDYDPTLDPVRFLVEPQVVALPDVISLPSFESFDAVVLADVPRLTAPVAESLASFVEQGGGLFVAAGSRSEASFYNDWTLSDGSPFLPARLEEDLAVAPPGEPFHASLPSLTHPALRKIASNSASDFADASFVTYRPQTLPQGNSGGAAAGARLDNGAVLLSSRETGRGRVVLFGAALDPSSGNLVTRQAFLPFLHEMIYHLADPAAYDLNLDPGWEVAIPLTGGGAPGSGLIARYFDHPAAEKPLVTRRDRNIHFNWLDGSPASGIPADRFRVEWSGKIRVPEKGRYTFDVDTDDYLELWLAGKRVAQWTDKTRTRKVQVRMESGRWYDFRAVFREETGDARITLYWDSEHSDREIIPPEVFRMMAEESQTTETAPGSALASFPVTGPGDRPRTAQITSSGEDALLRLEGDIAAGLYELAVPPEQDLFFTEFLGGESRVLPFTVRRDPAESRLTRLNENDYRFLADFVTLSEPRTLEELSGFLAGRQFGQELWKYLALGAFVFLLAEIALSRWIARSRRMGEEITVTFESKDAPGTGFREQLARMGKQQSA